MPSNEVTPIRKAVRKVRRLWWALKQNYLSGPNPRYFKKIKSLVPEAEHYYWVGAMDRVVARAKEQGFASLKEYYPFLLENEEELAWMRTSLTFKGTHFFRGDDWPFFIESVLATLAERDHVRVWCASCSSGEEAYSVLMALLDYVPVERIELLCSDYNDALLERARNGTYYMSHLDEIPERYQRHVIPGKPRFSISPELVGLMNTRNINLLTGEFPKGFDVVLCRNTLKFFTTKAIHEVQAKLAESVAAGGYLFLSDDGDAHGVELIPKPEALGLRQLDGRCIYQKVGEPQA